MELKKLKQNKRELIDTSLPPASMLAGKEKIFPSSSFVTHFESIDLTTIEI